MCADERTVTNNPASPRLTPGAKAPSLTARSSGSMAIRPRTRKAGSAGMAEMLLSSAVHDTVPKRYVRPESQRPRLAEVVSGGSIPVVDLTCSDRAAVVSAIGDACRSHGFFQVNWFAERGS
jgi:hypothetical protein